MPELPEVETIVRGLQGAAGSRITAVEVRWARTVVPPDPTLFAQRITSRRILEIGRRGKWLVLTLSGGETLLVHLRMSGRLVLESQAAEIDRHARALLTLDNGQRLRFSDQRKFGRMVLTATPGEILDKLGPEPLGTEFTPELLQEMLSQRRGRIKPLLLNQHFVVGLGNIYSDESLWRAEVHPLRPANSLRPAEATALHHAIQAVLSEAIAQNGTTLEDQGYVTADGQPGEFISRLAVYGRTGKPCPRCGTPVVRTVVGGRSTHFCPTCQRL